MSSLHALLGTTGVDAVVVAVDGSATRRELAALAESVALAGTSIAAAVVVEGAEPVVPAGSLAHQPAPTAQ